MVAAPRIHLGSNLNFKLMLRRAFILTPRQGAAGGLEGMELSQLAVLGSQTPLDVMREGVGKVETCFLGPPEDVAAGEVKMQ